MNKRNPLSAIELQILWDRLIAVVEEQAQALIRTGFSTSTREAGDLSAGVFDTEGRMLAQAVTGTPGHVNSMARSVGHFLNAYPLEKMAEGDVFITNDPWHGTGHLHDFTLVTPAFRAGKPIALFASTCHVVDVGGRGLTADATQVFEEGLNVPIMRFAKAGEIDAALIDIVKANVREPVQVVGDLYALAACNDTGTRRLMALMDDVAIDDLDVVARHILERSRQAALEAIAKLPHGTFRNSMRIDGYEEPIDLVAALTNGPDGLKVDYGGTSGLSRYAINVPHCYTEAYTAFGIKAIVYPDVPNNAGSLGVVRVSAPQGSILNAPFPSAVGLRHVTGQMLPDVVIGCLREALGVGSVPAEGASCLWILMLLGGHGFAHGDAETLANATPFNFLGFHAGGTGGRPGKDGLSATAWPSGVRNVPVEINEAISPLIVWRKEYRPDSGGAGAFRGGMGQVMELSNLEEAPFALSACFDRIHHPPRGRDGGMAGAPGAVRLAGDETLNGKGLQTIPASARLVLEMPGGGGLGDPLRRPADAVARDVRAGLVSLEEAARAYGVVVDAAGRIDSSATEHLREQRAAAP